MSNMNNGEIRSTLIEHNVTELFHANTVLTSINFLKNKGLCSRYYIDKLPNCYQTEQYSDAGDKKFGIYNDIFFDSVDIHNRANQYNKYGPVMFVYDIDLLLLNDLENKVMITKDNPIRWNTYMTVQDRYFMNISELQNDFHKGCFQQHITLHNTEMVNFQYLKKIIIAPLPQKYEYIFLNAYNTLVEVAQQADLEVNVTIRNCSNNCRCQELYDKVSPEYIKKMYKIRGEQ